jgi:hypothetical protein
MNANRVREYLRDFHEEFNHSTGASRHSLASAADFYNEWGLFISLVTGMSVGIVHRDNVLDLYSLANVCAMRCRQVMNVR